MRECIDAGRTDADARISIRCCARILRARQVRGRPACLLRIAHASAHVLFYTYHALYTRCARARYEGDPHACALHACALHALYTRLTRFICALNALYTFFLYMRFARALHALYAFHTRCARVRYEGDLEDDQLIRNADKQARTYMHACIHTYMYVCMYL